VKVNAVSPGPVLPPPGYPDEKAERVAQGTLLKRWGTPKDVADAVLFLIESDYITGEVITVDGGEQIAA
jgi:NAD(P)-dependent dehydrogenase (short-subunit alcohol dehydrogenase family)